MKKRICVFIVIYLDRDIIPLNKTGFYTLASCPLNVYGSYVAYVKYGICS